MRKIIITTESAGVRLDKFLAKEFFSMSRGEIIRQIKEGNVLVDKKKEKAAYIIKEGDELEIGLVTPKNKLVANENVQVSIIYEDENFIVLNKPAGIQVHPGKLREIDTLANWLIAKYPEIADVHDGSKDAELRPGIVHRLDRETSGVMIVAKKKESFAVLKEMFAKRKIQKTYLAIVYGLPKEKSGTIKAAIAKSADYRKQVVAKLNTKTKIREAVTDYLFLAQKKEISLVEAKPKTGRMHQIRVHLALIGHPIVGDKLYDSSKTKKVDVDRQMLHAFRLEFEYLGQKYAFQAPIPEDMKRVDGLIEMHYAKKAL